MKHLPALHSDVILNNSNTTLCHKKIPFYFTLRLKETPLLLSVLMVIFPRESGLAHFTGGEDDGDGPPAKENLKQNG